MRARSGATGAGGGAGGRADCSRTTVTGAGDDAVCVIAFSRSPDWASGLASARRRSFRWSSRAVGVGPGEIGSSACGVCWGSAGVRTWTGTGAGATCPARSRATEGVATFAAGARSRGEAGGTTGGVSGGFSACARACGWGSVREAVATGGAGAVTRSRIVAGGLVAAVRGDSLGGDTGNGAGAGPGVGKASRSRLAAGDRYGDRPARTRGGSA